MKMQQGQPREFVAGVWEEVRLREVAKIELEENEVVTFTTPSGTEYDVTRKEWGYYATPSLNARLPEFHLRPALVRSSDRGYIMLVEDGKEEAFLRYLHVHKLHIVRWLDTYTGIQWCGEER